MNRKQKIDIDNSNRGLQYKVSINLFLVSHYYFT